MGALDSALKKVGAAATLATVIDRYIKADRRVFAIGEPVKLMAKGRLGGKASEWKQEAFIGGEKLHLESAYVLGNEVAITTAPQGATLHAHIRLPLSVAIKVLDGMEASFMRWLDENDDGGAGEAIAGAIRAAEAEEFEQRKLEAGNHPDFGTW